MNPISITFTFNTEQELVSFLAMKGKASEAVPAENPEKPKRTRKSSKKDAPPAPPAQNPAQVPPPAQQGPTPHDQLRAAMSGLLQQTQDSGVAFFQILQNEFGVVNMSSLPVEQHQAYIARCQSLVQGGT